MCECDLCSIKKTTDKIYKLLFNELNINIENFPLCFHCGQPYEKDIQHCGKLYNTWKPICECLNKTTIRIVTGNYNLEE